MNFNIDQERFSNILHDKFLNTYPDTFIKCRTRDKDIYESANGCMYSWYMVLINKFSPYNLSPKYTRTNEEASNSDWSCVSRFVDDFEKEDNWEQFLIMNLSI